LNSDVEEVFDASQGELLGLGVTRYARVGGNGRTVGGQWKRLCIAFPSGELRNIISTLSSGIVIDFRSRFNPMVFRLGRGRISIKSSILNREIQGRYFLQTTNIADRLPSC